MAYPHQQGSPYFDGADAFEAHQHRDCAHPWATVADDGQPHCQACGLPWRCIERKDTIMDNSRSPEVASLADILLSLDVTSSGMQAAKWASEIVYQLRAAGYEITRTDLKS